MALINSIEFSKITRRYRCEDAIMKQIREFIVTSMIPDEDVVLNHCPVALNDLSRSGFLHDLSHRDTLMLDFMQCTTR